MKSNETYRKFKSFKGSKKYYNNLYAKYILNDESYKNLIVDRRTILSALYSSEFNEYLEKRNTEGPHLLISNFTEKGVNTVTTPKKENIITISVFKF